MKTKIILLTFFACVFAFTQVNAQKHKYYKSSKYTKYHTVKGYPNVYSRRSGTVYHSTRDRDYRYYRGSYRNLPPGQAKKIYGYKSAKTFAPGQQKKVYRNYRSYDRRYNRSYSNYYNDNYQNNGVATVIGSLLGF